MPSTEGGTTSGCEGSVTESCTGTTLGALGRPEGDGVLAPRVLAMKIDVKKLENGWPEVRVGFFFRLRSSRNGALDCLNFRTKWGFLQGK